MADHRDQDGHNAVTKAYIDFVWGVWAGTSDDDFKELLQSMEMCESWISLAKDSKKWQALEANFVKQVLEVK